MAGSASSRWLLGAIATVASKAKGRLPGTDAGGEQRRLAAFGVTHRVPGRRQRRFDPTSRSNDVDDRVPRSFPHRVRMQPGRPEADVVRGHDGISRADEPTQPSARTRCRTSSAWSTGRTDPPRRSCRAPRRRSAIRHQVPCPEAPPGRRSPRRRDHCDRTTDRADLCGHRRRGSARWTVVRLRAGRPGPSPPAATRVLPTRHRSRTSGGVAVDPTVVVSARTARTGRMHRDHASGFEQFAGTAATTSTNVERARWLSTAR